jgi:hypothetical protein
MRVEELRVSEDLESVAPHHHEFLVIDVARAIEPLLTSVTHAPTHGYSGGAHRQKCCNAAYSLRFLNGTHLMGRLLKNIKSSAAQNELRRVTATPN